MSATPEPDPFRADTRAWLEAHCPPSMRTPMPEHEYPWGGRNAEFPNPDTRLWLARMVDKGWTAPMWPREYGGAGLTLEQARVLEQEMARIGARPPLFSFGFWMLGPVLLELGSAEQKQRFLPAIARGEIRWCQGYSEPGAGSDLAALKTRAELRGDRFIVNGSKIWTSDADKADWIFCLVRTDFEVPKHQGISFLLFDLNSAGVERRPIKLISGASPFCQTFFDNVEVPAANLVGRLNGGWDIAKRLLQYERQNVAGAGFGADRSRTLWDIAKHYSPFSHDSEGAGAIDPDLRARIADQVIHAEAIDCLVQRMTTETSGQSASALASVLKVLVAKNNQLRSELLIEAMGGAGLGWDGDVFSDDELTEVKAWLRSKGNSIEGGTSEINLNIIAKRVLGLPDPR
jgi:alkylation response protein AidB-like acyl-CoA dehydrogenase